MGTNAEHGAQPGGASWRIIGWGAAALVLLTPLAAMRFTDQVAWTPRDFAFMGALLGGVGLALEVAVRKRLDPMYRSAVGVALAAAFLLIWLNGAVGLIGSENAAANLMYGGVLAVALFGAALARARPAGMARTMVATAVAQVVVPMTAWSFEPDLRSSVWSPEVVGLTGFFVALWLFSAWLFRQAAQNAANVETP